MGSSKNLLHDHIAVIFPYAFLSSFAYEKIDRRKLIRVLVFREPLIRILLRKRGNILISDDNNGIRGKHNLILENRSVLNMTGIIEVSGFNEEKITLMTQTGELTIGGYELHINGFSQDTGDLSMSGDICSLVYTAEKKPEGGFFSRLFR